MIDLNHGAKKEPRIQSLIDEALVAEQAGQEPRDYLGASRLGEKCPRALQFEFFHAQKDAGKDFDGRILRIFERGHWLEAAMIRWLRLAGFDLMNAGADGQQFGFATMGGLIKGHCDGVTVNGPKICAYPFLWENKGLGSKGWKDLDKKGLKEYSGTYYAQVQTYMAYLELTENPALFTAVNADTMEIYAEFVSFDGQAAQDISDRGVRIIQACQAGELLPRICSDPATFDCKFCSWHDRCWGLPA